MAIVSTFVSFLRCCWCRFFSCCCRCRRRHCSFFLLYRVVYRKYSWHRGFFQNGAEWNMNRLFSHSNSKTYTFKWTGPQNTRHWWTDQDLQEKHNVCISGWRMLTGRQLPCCCFFFVSRYLKLIYGRNAYLNKTDRWLEKYTCECKHKRRKNSNNSYEELIQSYFPLHLALHSWALRTGRRRTRRKMPGIFTPIQLANAMRMPTKLCFFPFGMLYNWVNFSWNTVSPSLLY